LKPETVIIADDHTLPRESLARVLARSGFSVVGQAADAVELLHLVEERMPSLAVVDIRMPPTYSREGLDAAWTIRQNFPHTGILLLSTKAELGFAAELLLREGAIGFLLKSRVVDIPHLLDALTRISSGATVVDPLVVAGLSSDRRSDNRFAFLSRREREVLALMAEGYSNTGIARRMRLAERTIQAHVHRVISKLELPPTADDHPRVRAVTTYLDADYPPA
jgi:DNA-binding NarL/FixJ family response regulator